MKKFILIIMVLLSGCASDPVLFERQMQHLEMARRLLTPPQNTYHPAYMPTQTRCVNYGYAVNCTQY